MERRAQDGGFKANYSSGGSVHFFEADDEAKEIAIKTSKVLNIDVGGIDLLFKENGGYTICEANTFPGFKGLEKASGVNVASRILEVMQAQLQKNGGLTRAETKALATHDAVITKH